MSAIPVIGVAGPVGSGKSTLVSSLASAIPGACAVYVDHYQRYTQRSMAEVRAWLDSGSSDLTWMEMPGLARDLSALRDGSEVRNPATGDILQARSLVIHETHFGHLHPDLEGLVDCLVWVNVPLDVAVVRRLQDYLRMFAEEGGSDWSQRIQWFEKYLDDYLGTLRGAMVFQAEHVAPVADLVIDGMQSEAAVMEEILAALRTRGFLSG